MNQRTRPGWSTLVLFLAIALGCGGGDLLLPDPPDGGENVALSKVTGDNQTGTVGEQLASPLVVQVLSPREQPVRGRRVAFVFTTAAGAVTPDTTVTNTDGQASARWVLGTEPGSHTVQARVVNGEGEAQATEFTAQARAAAPDTLSPQSALSQPGRRGHEVGTPPVVKVVDRFGNPVPDVPVAWSVISGEGQVEQPITQTGDDGTTTTKWTLGGRIGVHKLTAAIGPVHGSPVTFTATVLF